MSPSEQVLIDLTTRCPLVELVLFDTDMREVAQGVGKLHLHVPIGIYELYATAGGTTKTEIIPLRGDQPYVVTDYDVDFATVTPADGPIAEIAMSFTRWLTVSASAVDAGLVVVCADADRRVQVIDDHAEVISADADWIPATGSGWMAWSGVRPFGGHRIRYHFDGGVDDVPVWLSKGWQTVVFIPTYGGDSSIAATVVHMTPIGVPWRPDPDRDVLLEVMLDSGQRHQPPLPNDLLGVVRSHVDAPMLILAAVTLALKNSHPDLPALIDLALRLLPDCPDAQALRFVRREHDIVPPLRLPPTFATVFHRALLAADHNGRLAVTPNSTLSEAVPGLASNGPYVTQTVEPVTIPAWIEAHIPARPHPGTPKHPLVILAERSDVPMFAKVSGLTRNWAGEAVALLRAHDDKSWLDVWKDIGDDLVSLRKTFTAPGELAWDSKRFLLRLSCDRVQAQSVIRLSAASDSLPYSFPLLVAAPDDVSCLLNVVNGRAEWQTLSRGPFELRWPEADSVGNLPAYEALSIEPEHVPSFASDREPVHGQTIVPGGRFRMDTFEDDERNLELTVLSDHLQDVGTYALLVVRMGDHAPEKLVVPLSWLQSQNVASGALRVGRADKAIKVLVVPELQRTKDLDLDIVRRSIRRSADDVTERALREVETRLVAENR